MATTAKKPSAQKTEGELATAIVNSRENNKIANNMVDEMTRSTGTKSSAYAGSPVAVQYVTGGQQSAHVKTIRRVIWNRAPGREISSLVTARP
ncbi:MAG: hypothetical protein AMXMBFR84_15890 [Candidatus Hydrogenedentota bacterium]